MRRRAFLGASLSPLVPSLATAPTTVGLERVVRAAGDRLAGKRLGLLAHAASVTRDGRHAVGVLQAAGLRLVRLFAPEHGLRGQAAAGEAVAEGREGGLPVVSLYGARRRPSAEDLAGLDVLVVDLQDAGVRFYTYASTVLLCLEAAARASVEVLVLDRPNPLGGAYVAGPLRDPSLPFSLVSVAPGPLVHGLTLGELAQLAQGGRPESARLSVVTMEGWRRPMTWEDTGRPWPCPSPNLRSAEAALAYPGTCLLEATNVSEGRGTEAPFLRLGAPWLRAEAVAKEAAGAGFALEPTRFVPAASAAAPSPKYLGESCAGVRVRVVDRHAVRPWEMGLRLLQCLRRLHPQFAWVRGGAALDTLLGTRAVRQALDRGDDLASILASEAGPVRRFLCQREDSLLY